MDRYSSNAKIKDGGETPIYWAAWKVNKEIVIILAPRTDNPNASDKDRYIPNNKAARMGQHLEIVKIFGSFNFRMIIKTKKTHEV